MDWMNCLHKGAPLLAALALLSSALWIGTLFSVSWLSGRARMMADAPEIGRLALALFRRWTLTSLMVSLASTAAWWVGQDGLGAVRPGNAAVAGACAAGLLLLIVHLSVGARAKRVAMSV
jgi:hypothetical protein